MAARRLLAAAVLATWGALLASPAAAMAPSPSPSPGGQQSCRNVQPTDPGSLAGRVGCDVMTGGPAGPLQDVTQSAGQAASQAGQAVANATETAFTSWLANGAAWVVESVTQKVMGPSTTQPLDPTQTAAFTHVYGRVVGVALSLSVLVVLIGIIEATLTQRPGALRRVVAGIAVSGIGLGAVPVGTAILVRITDDLSWYVAGDQSQMVAQGLKTMVQLLQQTSPATGAAAFALTALGVMVGGALLWLELVTRESLIYLFLGVAPLACAAVQWPRLEGVLRQVLFAGLALILSKLVIAIALAVGFAVLASGNGLENLLGGMFILLVAGLMPFATARVLPLAAEELSQGHQGRLRTVMVGGTIGTTARVVTAITNQRMAARAAGVGIAPPMGSSGGGAHRQDSSGRGSSAQVAAAATTAEGRGSDRPADRAPRSEAAARRRGVPKPPPPPGPEPPRDGGPPPVT